MEKEIMVVTNNRIWGRGQDMEEACKKAKKCGASKGDECIVLKVPEGTEIDEMGNLVYKDNDAYQEGKEIIMKDAKII